MNAQTQHTPGPWTIQRDETGTHEYSPRLNIYGANGATFIGDVRKVSMTYGDFAALNAAAEANARLIAAAPELYEALVMLMADMGTVRQLEIAKAYARAALAKAVP